MIHKIAEGVASVGVLNPGLRVFDIVMSTDYGTSYNSYLVRGAEKTALIECCHRTFFQPYVENIQEICPLEEIDYIILNHNEPDHTGSLAQLLERMPKAQVLTSQAGSIYIKNITNIPGINLRAVKDGEVLDLGGKTLRFINAPFLHWPDSMFTWLEEDKILFTCDFFGAHYCEPQMMDSRIVYGSKYENAVKEYYDAIFGPFAPYVQKGLAKIQDLDIRCACVSHGPILTKGCRLEYVRDLYDQWSRPQKKERPLIPVFYCSAYGNTRRLAQAIQKGILSVKDADCQAYDLIDYPMSEMQSLLNSSDAFALGTPTINRDAVPPVWELVSHVDAVNCAGKPCLVFGSYGWSGEGLPNVRQRLESLKMKVFGDNFRVAFVPTQEDLDKAQELGKAFAQSL